MLVVMEIDQKTGELTLLQRIMTESKVARGAAFAPDGRYLLLACNDKQNVESYRVLADGTLELTNVSGTIAHPASIAFLRK